MISNLCQYECNSEQMSDYGLAVSNVAGTFVIISECTLKDITGKVESQGIYECLQPILKA